MEGAHQENCLKFAVAFIPHHRWKIYEINSLQTRQKCLVFMESVWMESKGTTQEISSPFVVSWEGDALYPCWSSTALTAPTLVTSCLSAQSCQTGWSNVEGEIREGVTRQWCLLEERSLKINQIGNTNVIFLDLFLKSWWKLLWFQRHWHCSISIM